MTTGSRSILVLDDDASVRQMLSHYLSRSGWQVVAVASGQEAIHAFKLGRFSAILADVDLDEELDGIQVVKHLLSQDPRLKVVIMSGRPYHAQRVEEDNVGTFLPKPFEPPQLGRILCCEP